MITMMNAQVGNSVVWLSLDDRRVGKVVKATPAAINVCFPATDTRREKTVRLARCEAAFQVINLNRFTVVAE